MINKEQKVFLRKKESEYKKRLKNQKKQNFDQIKKNVIFYKKKNISKKLPYLEDYKSYLKSPHWQKTKIRFFTFFEKKCEKCGSKEKINLHHTNYRKMGIEEKGDLIPLCQNCHTELHKIYGIKNLKKNTKLFITSKV